MQPKEKLQKGPVALYEQMRIKILELLRERNLQPHDPVPSEGELAELFGVSRRTSKQALQILADEGVVYRMPRRGTFMADGKTGINGTENARIASSIRTIGFLVPEINDYIGQIVASAIKEARQLGYELLLRVSDADLNEEAKLLKELVSEVGVAGVLLFPGDRTNCGNEVLRLHLNHYPIVIVDRTFKEVNISSVFHDHFQGALEMTKYLIRQGHTYIGFVSEPISGVMSREERYYGYVQAHQELDIALQLKASFTDVHLREGQTYIQMLEQYILDNPGMTAIFCSNDYVALHVSYAAQNVGLAVPQQLSIVGFTDSPICEWMKVPLTTVKKSTEELGRAAVSLLAERIARPDSESANVMLSTQIHERESVRRMM